MRAAMSEARPPHAVQRAAAMACVYAVHTYPFQVGHHRVGGDGDLRKEVLERRKERERDKIDEALLAFHRRVAQLHLCTFRHDRRTQILPPHHHAQGRACRAAACTFLWYEGWRRRRGARRAVTERRHTQP